MHEPNKNERKAATMGSTRSFLHTTTYTVAKDYLFTVIFAECIHIYGKP